MMAERDRQLSFLMGFEPELFKLVFKRARSGQLAGWLRLLLELAADAGEFGLASRLQSAGAEASRFHLAIRLGDEIIVKDELARRGQSPDERCELFFFFLDRCCFLEILHFSTCSSNLTNCTDAHMISYAHGMRCHVVLSCYGRGAAFD